MTGVYPSNREKCENQQHKQKSKEMGQTSLSEIVVAGASRSGVEVSKNDNSILILDFSADPVHESLNRGRISSSLRRKIRAENVDGIVRIIDLRINDRVDASPIVFIVVPIAGRVWVLGINHCSNGSVPRITAFASSRSQASLVLRGHTFRAFPSKA